MHVFHSTVAAVAIWLIQYTCRKMSDVMKRKLNLNNSEQIGIKLIKLGVSTPIHFKWLPERQNISPIIIL